MMLTMLKLPAGGVREEVSFGVISNTMLLTNACRLQLLARPVDQKLELNF